MVTGQKSHFHEIYSFRVISFLSYGVNDKGYTKMLHYVCTIRCKIEIVYHGCYVAMVTSQKSTSV